MHNHKHYHMATAGAITAAIVYSINTLFWYLMPEKMLMLFAQMKHLDNANFMAPLVHVTMGSYLMGLVHVIAFVFITLWIFSMVKCHLHGHNEQYGTRGKGCGRLGCLMGAACTCQYNCTCKSCCPGSNCK